MKNSGHPLLSFAAPFLLVLAFLGLMQRQGSDQLQSLPALMVGTGLILTGTLGRRSRRNKLLMALRDKGKEVS